MAKNHEVLHNSDLSEYNKRMRDSNLEDDTEDYIQPSQPLSFQSPNPGSVRKKMASDNEIVEVNISAIDETLPFPKSMMSTPFGDTTRDFIPESENPVKRKVEIETKEEVCKKRLNLDESSLIKETADMFSTESQLNETVDSAHLKVYESPPKLGMENVSLVPESPPRINETLESQHSYTMFSESEKRGVLEETTAEESLNDESGNFYVSDISKTEISGIGVDGRADRITEDVGGEIITIDSSSKFMDDSGMTSLLRSGNTPGLQDEKKLIDSHETQLDDTVDAEDMEYYNPYSSEKSDVAGTSGKEIQPEVTEALTTPIERDSESASMTIDAKPEVFRPKSVLKNISDEELARLQKHSTPENPLSKSPKINESASSIENGTPPIQDGQIKPREINFTVYLQVDCQLVMEPHKGEPVSKKIVNVKELIKRQPKQFFLEPNSDSSYKTKIFSSSSSGSVYSDKTGLPYPLPSRSLPASSVNSSSSPVDLAKHIKIVERQVWASEYKIPMAIDEMIPRYIEEHKMSLQNNDGKGSAKRKISMRVRKKKEWSHPLDNVLESSVTEQSSGNNSEDILPALDKSDLVKPPEILGKNVNKLMDKDAREIVTLKVENEVVNEESDASPRQNESGYGIICEGLLVFARWTDKRYYPGRVRSKAKYDRWEVKFDDDTEKIIREDMILPLNWLTKGELVFALAADKYASGKIADIIREGDIKFRIELDNTNEEIIVNKCDICLNDVMAGIIREKFKPSNKFIPTLKSSDIDVDNVLTGKRVREQRTPVRGMQSIVQPESSTAKKRKGGLRLSESGTGDKQTPVKKRTPLAKRELNSEKKTRSSRKKGTKPEMEDVPAATKETPARSDSKSDGRKKRTGPLKYDSDKSEFPNKKLRKCESLISEEAHKPATGKGSKSGWKTTQISGIDVFANDEITENAENGKVEKESSLKKPSKNEKGKVEKGGSKLATRSGKRKPFRNGEETKKKKKSL